MSDNPLLVIVAALGIVVAIPTGFAALAGRKWAICAVIVALVFLLDSSFRTRDVTDKTVDFQTLLKFATWAFGFVYAITRLQRLVEGLFTPPQLLWLAFFAWTACTASYAPNPTYSLVAVFSLVAMYLFFTALTMEHDQDTIVMAIVIAVAIIGVASLVVYVAVPSIGRMHTFESGMGEVAGNRLAGISGTPNSAGRVAALGLLLMALRWQQLKERLGLLVCGALALPTAAVLLLSNSRTSLAVLIILVGLNVLARPRYRSLLFVGLGLGLFGLMVLIPYSEQAMVMLSRTGDATEIETGTSRAQIWHTVIQLATTKFWTGWGYASSLFVLPNYAGDIGHAPVHSHNLFLQLWFSTGAIGVLLFLSAFFIQVLLCILRRDALSISLLAFVGLNGLTESSAFTGVANITTLALALSIACVARPQPQAMPAWAYPAGSLR